jgi:putative flippase GtrA
MVHVSAVDLLDKHATGKPAPGFVQRAIRFPRTFILFFVGNPGRLVRFCLTGGVAALVQLLVLRLLTADHWEALLSNGIGMAVAAQVNFTLSSAFTWRDRWVRAGLHRRWSMYQLTILASAVVNMLVFIVARLFLEQMIAALLGIAVAAALNFAAGDRLIFRLKQAVAALDHDHPAEPITPPYAEEQTSDRAAPLNRQPGSD